METLYSTPVRNRNNDTLSTGDLLLSDFVTVATLGDIRLRLQIDSIDPDSTVQIFTEWRNGAVVLFEFTKSWSNSG